LPDYYYNSLRITDIPPEEVISVKTIRCNNFFL